MLSIIAWLMNKESKGASSTRFFASPLAPGKWVIMFFEATLTFLEGKIIKCWERPKPNRKLSN